MSTPPTSSPPPAGDTVIEDCGPRLRALYPALFTNPPKPLKLRIQADIQARSPGEFTKAQLSAFLRRYTGSYAYLTALTKATHRYDLDGNAGDELSAEHRQAAIDELARRRQNQQSRRALEDEQRHNRAELLRDFERTTLTPANFCALKGLPLEELEPLLERARHEAAEAPRAFERDRRGPPQRPEHGERGGRNERGPRGDRAGGGGRDQRGARPPRPAGPGASAGSGAPGGHRPEGAPGSGPRSGAPRGTREDRPRGPRGDAPRTPQGRPDRGPRPAQEATSAPAPETAMAAALSAAKLAGSASAPAVSVPPVPSAPAPAPAASTAPAADSPSMPSSTPASNDAPGSRPADSSEA